MAQGKKRPEKQYIIRAQQQNNNPNIQYYIIYDLQKKKHCVHVVINTENENIRAILRTRLNNYYSSFYNRDNRNLFQSDLEIIWQKERVEVRMPYLQFITLKCFIQRNNCSLIDNASFLPNLFFPLVRNLILIKQESLAIPTFSSILVSSYDGQINLNHLSLAGLEILLREKEIKSYQIKETLAFFTSNHFISETAYPNMRRALAILLLGIIIGKQIDLHPKVNFNQKTTTTLETVKQLIEQNKRKCQIILKNKQVKQKLRIIEEQYELKLTDFLETMLLKESDMSWGEVINSILQPERQKYTIELGETKKNKIDLVQYIMKIATFKFKSLTKEQQQSYINNQIVSIKSANQQLELEDAEMLLIAEYSIDFQMLKPFKGSLAAWLFSLQDTETTHYTHEVHEIRNKFLRDVMAQIQIFTPQSHMMAIDKTDSWCQLKEDELGQDVNQAKKQKQKLPKQIHQTGIEHQNEDIEFFPQSIIHTVKQQKRKDLFSFHDKLAQEEKLNEKKLPFISCQIFKETYIHKFKASEKKVGNVIDDRMKTLMEYSNFMTS